MLIVGLAFISLEILEGRLDDANGLSTRLIVTFIDATNLQELLLAGADGCEGAA